MRCKVGDLAMIVRADNDPEALGRVVRVVALRIAMGDLAWQVEPPTFWHDKTGLAFEVMWDDRDLKPLKGFGDGAPELTEEGERIFERVAAEADKWAAARL